MNGEYWNGNIYMLASDPLDFKCLLQLKLDESFSTIVAGFDGSNSSASHVFNTSGNSRRYSL